MSHTNKQEKISNNLRNLLMRQPETLMLNRTKAIYLGEVYTFKAITREEAMSFVARVQKNLSPNTFICTLRKCLNLV